MERRRSSSKILVPAPALPQHFVPLRRRFRSLGSDSRNQERGLSLYWPDVLTSRVAVVMAQHSCGKTTELLALAHDKPEHYWYCELQDLESHITRFETEPALLPEGVFHLLLDSMEEASASGVAVLNGAFMHLAQLIRTHKLKNRLRIVLCCRPSSFGGSDYSRLDQLDLGAPDLFELLPLDESDQETMGRQFNVQEPLSLYGVLDYPWRFLQALRHGPEVTSWSAAERQRRRIEDRLRIDLGTRHVRISDFEQTWRALESLAMAAALSGRTRLSMTDSADEYHLNLRDCQLGLKNEDLSALLDSSLFRNASNNSYQFAHQSFLEYLAASGLTRALQDGRMQYEELRAWIFHEDEDGRILRTRLVEVVLWLTELAHESTQRILVKELEEVEPALLFERQALAPRERQHFRRLLLAIDRRPTLSQYPISKDLRHDFPELARVIKDSELQAEARLLIESQQLKEPGLIFTILKALVAADRIHLPLAADFARGTITSRKLGFGSLSLQLMDLLYLSDAGRSLAAELELESSSGAEEAWLAPLLHPRLPNRDWWDTVLKGDHNRHWKRFFDGAAPDEILRVLGYYGEVLETGPDFQMEHPFRQHTLSVHAVEALLALPTGQLLAIEPRARPFLACSLLNNSSAPEGRFNRTNETILVAAYVRYVVENGLRASRQWQIPSREDIVLDVANEAAAWLNTPAEFEFLRQLTKLLAENARCRKAQEIARNSQRIRSRQPPWFANSPGWLLNLLVYWRHFWRKQLGPGYPIIEWQDSWPPEALGRLSRRAAWLFATHVCQRELNTSNDAIKSLVASGNVTVQSVLKQALFNEFAKPRSTLDRGVLIRIDWSSSSLLTDNPWLIQALCEVLMHAPQLPREEARLAVKLIRESGIKIPTETARKIAARAPDSGVFWCLWAEIEPERAIEALNQLQPHSKESFFSDISCFDHWGPNRYKFWSTMARSDSIKSLLDEMSGHLDFQLLIELAKADTVAAKVAAKDAMRIYEFGNVLRAIRDNIANKPLPFGTLLPVIQTSLATRSTPADFEVDGIGGLWKISQNANKGAQGLVWKVRDHNHCVYALKEIQLDQDLEVHRVEREIKALRLHSSFHLPKLYGSSKDLGSRRAFLLMEWINGRVVAEMKPTEIDRELLANLVADVVQALEELHRLNCMHRDVRPWNIMREQLDGRSRFVLLDLGLAVFKESKRYSQSLVGNEIFLPPHYRGSYYEPEMPIDIGRDLYGLGATTIWLGLGERRKEFETAWRIAYNHCCAEPLLPFAQNLGMSSSHQEMLTRMVGPYQNWPTLTEVRGAFPSGSRSSTSRA